MANKSNNSRKKQNTYIPAMGNNRNNSLYQQPINKKQVFDKRRKDNAKVKY
jgi:hypothetical protein